MKLDSETQAALDAAWNYEASNANLERWLGICVQEKWGNIPQDMPLLATVFGASWYFTRFIFYRGPEAAVLIDQPFIFASRLEFILSDYRENCASRDFEANLNQLHLIKNEIMLQILLAQLKGDYDQIQTEQALTRLAEAVLQIMIMLCGVDQEAEGQYVVLGMGRIAGFEMTYGSDLDIIFLSQSNEQDVYDRIGKRVRKMLRMIPAVNPAGSLYEVDMRLRPHGNAGTLISPLNTFIDHHSDEREIWERQMMTRCRPIAGDQTLSDTVLGKLMPCIYSEYDDRLRTEVLRMRQLVQHELGSSIGKYDIKRGEGGIMDIDFITHYLQLLHGRTHPSLQTASTRDALRQLASTGLLKDEIVSTLLKSYDFLKMVEARLRVFDMKSINQFSKVPEENSSLARAMGYYKGNTENAAIEFMENYLNTTRSVRQQFKEIIGWD
jgi:glutamate-ammonia-ligase adenylyltransferase